MPQPPFDRMRGALPPGMEMNRRPLLFGFMPALLPLITYSFNFLLGAILKIYLEWKNNDSLRKKVETEKINSELQFLKTQLNPHFLFNSLNAIYSLSVKKSPDTSEAIINLSELMRYMLYEANRDFVPLSKELTYIQNYIQLQRLRLSNSEEVSINIYGEEKERFIPPLLFISFIENAFMYGTDYQGKTHVKIILTFTDTAIRLFVQNKIGHFKKDSNNSGVGLENIKNRLQLLYPDAHTLKVDSNNEYYTVDLTLNTSKDEVHHNRR
jgi:LytS/YehU family sensor histidine kinase